MITVFKATHFLKEVNDAEVAERCAAIANRVLDLALHPPMSSDVETTFGPAKLYLIGDAMARLMFFEPVALYGGASASQWVISQIALKGLLK